MHVLDITCDLSCSRKILSNRLDGLTMGYNQYDVEICLKVHTNHLANKQTNNLGKRS